MRTALTIALALALVPATIQYKHFHHKSKVVWKTGEAGYGRGLVIPPTVHEMRKVSCLATMVYGEARGETKDGKVAVAYSAINRSGKKTVCEVVLAPYQYSIFNNNPALRAAALSLQISPSKKNVIEEKAWDESVAVAEAVIKRKIPDPTKGATHYLAPVAMKSLGYKYPRWSKEFKLVAVVDRHHFYKPVDKARAVAVK